MSPLGAVAVESVDVVFASAVLVTLFLDVRLPAVGRVSTGLLLLVRALRRPGTSSSSLPSSLTGNGVASRLLAARVMGPVYSSASRSEGVGLGEMMRGVAGILLRVGMLCEGKGGRAGNEMAPERIRCRS